MIMIFLVSGMTTNVTLIHNDTRRVHLKGTQLYTRIFKVLKLMMTGYHNDQSFNCPITGLPPVTQNNKALCYMLYVCIQEKF